MKNCDMSAIHLLKCLVGDPNLFNFRCRDSSQLKLFPGEKHVDSGMSSKLLSMFSFEGIGKIQIPSTTIETESK